MPDPAEKSDDLIAELAKMMSTPVEPVQAAPPPPVVAPPPPAASAPPIRIPGMDMPRPAAPVDAAPRAPVTGVIRIPGMDHPAPVATSAPVGRLDFGRPASAPPVGQEPLTNLADRIAARAAEMDKPKAEPAPPAQAIRFPELRTVSENKSFATGPAITPAAPPAAPPANGDFTFDFGFSKPAPSAATPVAPRPAAPVAVDPIAALINADLSSSARVADGRPVAPVIPVLRTNAPPAPPKPAPAPTPPRQAANAPIPLRPVTQRPPEADRFTISPGAGLNMRVQSSQPLNAPITRAPAPPPPPQDSDPMSEIENLIGEAVRVELTTGPVRVQTAAPVVTPHVAFEPEAEVEDEIHSEPPPVVPPLTTQFAPRRSAIKDEGHAAAEDAIIAAAAATGAPVERLDPSMTEESPYRRLKVKPQRSNASGLRQYVGMAVAGTLLLAAGLGLYWVLNMGRTANVEGSRPPQLTASTAAVKEVAKAADKPVTDVTKSPVMQQMEGVSQAPSAEQLVTTDQTAGTAPVDTPVAAADAQDVSEGGLANRKVRTVTVRPDGSIVSGDDAVAGNEALLVDRPNVPAVPGTQGTDLAANDVNGAAGPGQTPAGAASSLIPLANIPETPATTVAATDDVQPVMNPTLVAPKPMSFPVRSTGTQSAAPAPKSSVNAIVADDQSANGQINLLGADALAPQKPAPAPRQVATAPQAAPTPAGASGAPAYVQIASSLSEGDANAAVKAATAKYGSAFEGNSLVVQQADLGTKGVRWRVRLPATSLSDANGICAQIKALGGDCFATSGG